MAVWMWVGATVVSSERGPVGSVQGHGQARRRRNLPAQPTPLLARAGDVDAARQQLLRDDVRLLTLTGPGGVGKTRLALAVAEALLVAFPDGAWLVDLATLSDASLVVSAVAGTLGVHQLTDRPLLDSLCDHLRDRRALLVLDNVEHLLAAAPDLSRLLQACPDLKLLVTSRVLLRSRWEHAFVVEPLDVPGLGAATSFGDVAAAGAVALFVQRAQAVTPDFVLTDESAPVVAELCVRLDGLPLAIELAAARTPVLAPRDMLARLPERLALLVSPAPDQPARHRTLRDAIAWSYDLLPPAERALFRRLSVFAGGFDLDAATGLATGVGRATSSPLATLPDGHVHPPIDALAALVGASLLRRDVRRGGTPRFRLLETIRAYALEQLTDEGELDDARHQHADYYLTLAEDPRRSPHWPGAGPVA
jgi:predicted ATPase